MSIDRFEPRRVSDPREEEMVLTDDGQFLMYAYYRELEIERDKLETLGYQIAQERDDAAMQRDVLYAEREKHWKTIDSLRGELREEKEYAAALKESKESAEAILGEKIAELAALIERVEKTPCHSHFGTTTEFVYRDELLSRLREDTEHGN